jgi:spermidine/putrescine transport system permease protein
MAPGLLWLAIFFVLPNLQMVAMSLSSGTLRTGFDMTWNFGNYVEAITEFPVNYRNSIVYGGLATLLTFLIGYPLAYGIAFRGGRYKTLLLFLVIAPFFTSFLLRTISWRIILGESSPILALARELGAPPNFTFLRTPLAVVSGLTYQFLPFMVLPLYVDRGRLCRRGGDVRPRLRDDVGERAAHGAPVHPRQRRPRRAGGRLARLRILRPRDLPVEPARRVRRLDPHVHPGHR